MSLFLYGILRAARAKEQLAAEIIREWSTEPQGI